MSQSEAARQVGVDETTIIDSVFSRRMAARYEELKSLYCGLYHNDMAAFEYFCGMLERSFNSCKASLLMLDAKRLAAPDWFWSNQLMGMMLYRNAFARNLNKVDFRILVHPS
ncbi:MAG: hypothetical protein ACI4PH_05960 [Faecousia sp.]